MERGESQGSAIPPCPFWFFGLVYLLYLGVVTRESLPIFAPIEWLHEGERLGTAQIVVGGGLPFRDVYLTHGLLPNVLRPLAAFWMFGESLAADRLLGILLEPLSYIAAVFYVWRVFPTVSWRVAGLIGFAVYPLHLEPRHILVFVSLGFLTAWTYERRRGLLVAAGACSGLAFVGSTVDQAGFLLATIAAFPAVLWIEGRIRSVSTVGGGEPPPMSGVSRTVAVPLYGGVLLGLAPFLAYLILTGTGRVFLSDTLQRILFDTIVRRDPYPSLTFSHAMWYAIPAFYGMVAVGIVRRICIAGDRHWTPIYPTLLFGILSFGYAMRGCCAVYGKLAIVSFPFIVGLLYVLWVVDGARREQAARGGHGLLLLSAAWTGMILIHAVSREWTAKQAIPRALFPMLALLLLVLIVGALTARGRETGWGRWLRVACPLGAVILGASFYHDAKPHLLTAQIKKPRLVKDVAAVVPSLLRQGGRFTRDDPAYVQDELLAYIKTAAVRRVRVVVLAAGAGVYYFVGNSAPPNRFPEVYHAQIDSLALEVVEGLERTGGEVLVACGDDGEAITGWPMNKHLSQYLRERYTDTGRRVGSALLGPACPFQVWAPRHYAERTGDVTG